MISKHNMTEEYVNNRLRYKLRELMNLKGWTIRELSKKSGVSASTISRYLTGATVNITSHHLIVLLKTLGCGYLYF